MATTRLLIEYQGTAFNGWAVQPALRTVQGDLERALQILRGEPVSLIVAGRTDVGVHAWGQVASYDGDPVDVKSLNGILADDVSVLACEAVADGFSARHDAESRTYCYQLLNRPQQSPFLRETVLHVRAALDREALAACAAALRGSHDFTAFTPTETQHTRFVREVLRSEWVLDGDRLVLLDRGTQLSAQHEQGARRDDAGRRPGQAQRRRVRAPARRRAARGGRTHRPGARSRACRRFLPGRAGPGSILVAVVIPVTADRKRC